MPGYNTLPWKKTCLAAFLTAAAAETFLAYISFKGLDPFPYNEFYFRIFERLLRDMLLGLVVYVLCYRRSRIPDRSRRYLPVAAAGAMYLAAAFFMVHQLSLDKGFETTLAVLTGLNNNILPVLLAAFCYYKWPNGAVKFFYFLVYLFTAFTIAFDAGYFWQTSMHVESVVFQNLNIYSVKGVLATTDNRLIAALVALVALVLMFFRVPEPAKRKPNFAWSLFCAAAFTVGLNLADRALGYAGMCAVRSVIGMYAEVENEKTRMEYRKMLTVPVSLNFIGKALFDTDKIVSASHVELRELTDKDRTYLARLGIYDPKAGVEKIAPCYDRVVMLILESVHRDYINYYNEKIPAEATPFLNSLLKRYPHLNRFYTSSVPTTQGLNAIFRSHVIMDRDIPGRSTPSLFRIAQAAGMRGIYMNASSQYYADEMKEYPEQFGMGEYYAKEYLEDRGYTGASGWGFHNDVMYKETLRLLSKGRNERLLLVTKTLDMHQPYPYTGFSWGEMPERVRSDKNFTVRGLYWVDKTLENFFSEAEKRGLMDERTLFIITSDHNPHSGGEYMELVADAEDKLSIAPIPLIFVSANLKPLDNLAMDAYASQIDLAPTLLYLLGLDVPEIFMGRNILADSSIPYALGYFGGKAFYWSKGRHFVDKMDNPAPESPYEDALSNYIVHYYGLWHEAAEGKVK